MARASNNSQNRLGYAVVTNTVLAVDVIVYFSFLLHACSVPAHSNPVETEADGDFHSTCEYCGRFLIPSSMLHSVRVWRYILLFFMSSPLQFSICAAKASTLLQFIFKNSSY